MQCRTLCRTLEIFLSLQEANSGKQETSFPGKLSPNTAYDIMFICGQNLKLWSMASAKFLMKCLWICYQVADFGLSKEEVFDGRKSSLKGTYGYMDPAYISTSKSSLKSDIYSLGIIFFELITAIHPHKNLMDYVNLVSLHFYHTKKTGAEFLIKFCCKCCNLTRNFLCFLFLKGNNGPRWRN